MFHMLVAQLLIKESNVFKICSAAKLLENGNSFIASTRGFTEPDLDFCGGRIDRLYKQNLRVSFFN